MLYGWLLNSISFQILPCVIELVEADDFSKDSNFVGRKHRTMSCPARVTTGERSRLGSKSNFSGLNDLRRGFVSTIKTLAIIFLYLLMSLPLQMTNLVHGICLKKAMVESSMLLNESVCIDQYVDIFTIFFNIFIFFLAIYPYVWLLLDKRFARKTCGICINMMRSRDQSMIH